MRNITLSARNNIRNLLSNTGNQLLVEQQMMEVLRTRIRFTKKNATLMKMKKLRQLKIGTTVVEFLANKVENTREVRCEKTVNFIMDRQIEKIEEEIKAMKAKMFTETKEAMKQINMEWRRNRMKAVFKEETEAVWEAEKVKVMKTVGVMKEKFRKKKDEKTRTCRGIVISEDLSEEEQEKERKSEKAVTEGIEVNEDEEAFLKVPNKMADNCNFNKVKMMTDVQMMMSKIRMSLRKAKEDTESGLTAEELKRAQEVEDEARRVINLEEKTVDFSKKRVTDFKTCRRITLPSPLEGDVEAKLKTLEGGLEGAILREEKRVLGLAKKETQLTDQEVRGKESLKEREKEKEGVYMTCDKSGKCAFVSAESYDEKMKEHMNDDTIVTLREVELEEQKMSAMASQLSRILKMGEGWKQVDRVLQAVKSEHTGVPVLDGMLKDHKLTEKLPVRPVCKSGRSPNGVLSDLASDILVAVIREKTDRRELEERRLQGETELISDLGEVRSTEEMQAKVVECNLYIERQEKIAEEKGEEKPIYVVGSNDVKALYPSCLTEPSARVVRQSVEKSELDFNVDIPSLTLFLASTMEVEELKKEGIKHLCHSRKNKKGGKPGITSECITGSEEERRAGLKQMWRRPKYKPDRNEKMKMLGIMMQIVVTKVMKCHFYKYKNTVRRQRDGGSIGLRMTGEVATLRMLDWDEDAREKILDAGAEEAMFGRYVDDVDHVYRALPKGSEYNTETGKIQINPEKAITDREVEDDVITFEVIKDIINTIDKDIQMTGDVPSTNTSKRVPVLDMDMFMKNNRVMFSFYAKPMSTKFVIPERSAHPQKIKRTTLIQEGVRRLLNVSPDLPEEERQRVMTEYDIKMRFSGYSRNFRWNAIDSAYSIYLDKLKQQEDGIRPLYRHREYQRAAREKQKTKGKDNWYKGDELSPNMAPLIVDPTPGGNLLKEMQKVCSEFKQTHGIGIRLVERGGQRIASGVKSNPLGEKSCGREKCPICRGERPGRCDRPGVGYRQTCKQCKEKGVSATYEGETSRTGFQRGLEHDRDMSKKTEDSPLWKHSTIHHEEMSCKFEMEITGTHRTPMERLNDEVVRIKSSNSSILLNSKNDWAQPSLVRIVAVVGNHQETQQGDTQITRQERRNAAREQQGVGDTPTRRRRRRAAPTVDSPATPRRAARGTEEQQQDRAARRTRRQQQQ
jgi:hypothetical protein